MHTGFAHLHIAHQVFGEQLEVLIENSDHQFNFVIFRPRAIEHEEFTMSRTIISSALATLIIIAGPSLAGGFTIDWHTIDCGGGVSAGGPFELHGSIGQHDAAPASTGGSFTLTGGFWPGGPAAPPDCTGDLNPNGAVNAADLAILLGAWSIPPGTPGCLGDVPCPADLTGDGLVNAADLAILLGAWGSCA